MILLSWPSADLEHGEVPLDVFADVDPSGTVTVGVVRGAKVLTRDDVRRAFDDGPVGHECTYRGGMWTVEGGSIRRRNASVQAVCEALLSDMREHSMAYRIPMAALEEVLSVERMEKFCLALEVMRS